MPVHLCAYNSAGKENRICPSGFIGPVEKNGFRVIVRALWQHVFRNGFDLLAYFVGNA